MNLALISPNKNAYSETFIKAQKDFLPFNVFYYYNGFLPKKLDGHSNVAETGNLKKIKTLIGKKLKLNHQDYLEYALEKSFKKNKIEAVLAQYGPAGVAVMPVCKELNIPLIVHFHGYDASVYICLEKYKQDYKKLFNYAGSIIAVSRAMGKKLIELGCNPDKITIQPCAPNNSFFEVQPKFSKPHFVGIGRFTDKKAPYYTILAFSKVLEQFPEAGLTIGGTGELYNTCINLIKYLGIEKSVDLPGVIKPEEFRNYLEESIAFVQHSIIAYNGDSEGTPVAVMESGAAGLPVIGTKHAGIPDVVVNSETGLLVSEHDVEGMAESMKRVLEDKRLAVSMGKAGRERIKSRFSMSIYINALSCAIETAVNNQ